MSIRLVTEDVLRLDVDVETYNRMFREIQQKLDERYGELISELIESKLTEKFIQQITSRIDYEAINYQAANMMNYGRVIDHAKTELVAHLLSDERFKTLVQRGLNIATVGLINETVERVSTLMQENNGIAGDV
ncbi:hypothetical protein EB118_08175 [bacterium]|jgi:hypothetical protein|nr:hypothetical protein [bacterium]